MFINKNFEIKNIYLYEFKKNLLIHTQLKNIIIIITNTYFNKTKI